QLCTVDGLPVEVIQPGQWNTHQGPDFIHAQVRIGHVLFAGSVELHLRSGDWQRHAHDNSKHYENVILHVVYTYEGKELTGIPTLVLGNRIAHSLLHRYQHLMESSAFVACSQLLNKVQPIVWQSWLERLLHERMAENVLSIQALCEKYKYHWEHILWHRITAKFSPGINRSAFEELAHVIPYTKLWRERMVEVRVEAMITGMSGLLENIFIDAYPQMLQKEFQFLQHKYKLRKIHNTLHFLRMRPANFPGIRLSQLARLMLQSEHLFDQIKNTVSWKDCLKLLKAEAHPYWNQHYQFDQPSAFSVKVTGRQWGMYLMLNAVMPVLFTYATLNKDTEVHQRLLLWFQQMPAEQNHIIRNFTSLGCKAGNAGESQAMLHLKRHYCDERKCLDCAAGTFLLNKPSSP
ncbi:MAG: DUF2851 family protein, partial [Ferruginibacter sp.]|nr:DUF2851 family protein [Ferruginibacter sp.]